MPEPDLPTRILNYLQDYEHGRTEEQIDVQFRTFPSSVIRVALEQLRKDECVTFISGLWCLNRDATN